MTTEPLTSITPAPVPVAERYYASNETRRRDPESDALIDHHSYEAAVNAGVMATRGTPGATFEIHKYVVVLPS